MVAPPAPPHEIKPLAVDAGIAQFRGSAEETNRIMAKRAAQRRRLRKLLLFWRPTPPQ
jgi:hypothetical protein